MSIPYVLSPACRSDSQRGRGVRGEVGRAHWASTPAPSTMPGRSPGWSSEPPWSCSWWLTYPELGRARHRDRLPDHDQGLGRDPVEGGERLRADPVCSRDPREGLALDDGVGDRRVAPGGRRAGDRRMRTRSPRSPSSASFGPPTPYASTLPCSLARSPTSALAADVLRPRRGYDHLKAPVQRGARPTKLPADGSDEEAPPQEAPRHPDRPHRHPRRFAVARGPARRRRPGRATSASPARSPGRSTAATSLRPGRAPSSAACLAPRSSSCSSGSRSSAGSGRRSCSPS